MITYNPYNWEIRKDDQMLEQILKEKQRKFVEITTRLEIEARHYNFTESTFWHLDQYLKHLNELLDEMGKIAVQLGRFDTP